MNIMEVLSEQAMMSYLESLRKALQGYDYRRLYNVVFVNMESFYCYMRDVPCACGFGREKTVEDVLDVLTPYIPYALDENNFGRLVQYMLLTDAAPDHMEKNIILQARIDFMNLVRKVRTPEEWRQVISICNTIRTYREDRALSPV